MQNASQTNIRRGKAEGDACRADPRKGTSPRPVEVGTMCSEDSGVGTVRYAYIQGPVCRAGLTHVT